MNEYPGVAGTTASSRFNNTGDQSAGGHGRATQRATPIGLTKRSAYGAAAEAPRNPKYANASNGAPARTQMRFASQPRGGGHASLAVTQATGTRSRRRKKSKHQLHGLPMLAPTKIASKTQQLGSQTQMPIPKHGALIMQGEQTQYPPARNFLGGTFDTMNTTQNSR